MNGYLRRDFESYDDQRLTPQQLARVWQATPEELRHGLMNMVYCADEQLHNQVVALTKPAARPKRSTEG